MALDTQSARSSPAVAKHREHVALAEGHSDLLRMYFAFQGYVGLLLGVALLLKLILGNAVTLTVQGRPWVVFPLAALNTWAAFRTRRLLREGDLDGVWMAAGVFGCDFLGAIATGHPGIGTIFSGIGLLLTGSVWRGMRASDALIAATRSSER